MNLYLSIAELRFLEKLIEACEHWGKTYPSLEEQKRLLARIREQLKYAP